MPRSRFICTCCKKADCGDGVWSKLTDEPAPDIIVNVICPDCCHERFPQFYSDYEKPEGNFSRKIFRGLIGRRDKE